MVENDSKKQQALVNKPAIAFETLGCKLNFAETSAIARSITAARRVPFDGPADVYAINTCTVTANAEKKLRELVRQIKRRRPGAKVIAFGCFAQRDARTVAAIPGVDLVLGLNEKFRLNEYIEPLLRGETGGIVEGESTEHLPFLPAFSSGDRTRSFLKIQDGCDYPCTYCIIPAARGKGRNPTLESIVEQARMLAGQGVKEIILTGVNIGTFRDESGANPHNFLDLIRALDQVEGVERYRISSIEPNLLTGEIIRFTLTRSRAFLPHFHIPLQSGSNTILALMRRRYRRELHRQRVEQIKALRPDAGLGVDVIVGFPGETDEQFRETYAFLKELPFTYLHVFPYSDRPGTPASQMSGKVPAAVKKERSRLLRELSARKHGLFVSEQLGQVRPVLFENDVRNGRIYGWTDNYIRVSVPNAPHLPESICRVRLVEQTAYGATGKIIEG